MLKYLCVDHFLVLSNIFTNTFEIYNYLLKNPTVMTTKTDSVHIKPGQGELPRIQKILLRSYSYQLPKFMDTGKLAA